jgi:hypothetical protein
MKGKRAMRDAGARLVNPELRDLVAEATRALAGLDAERLEELALSCRALNRDLETAGPAWRNDMTRQARDAERDLAIFGRVLAATRANLGVMIRIRALRQGRPLEYGTCGARTGNGYGDN